MSKRYYITILIVALVQYLGAQVSVSSASLQSFNVTPITVCQAVLMNSGGETSVKIKAQVFNSAGQELLTVTTAPIVVRTGMNSLQPSQIQTASVVYGSNAQAGYVQTQHQLPSGVFRHCITVFAGGGEPQDEYCQELESSATSFLNLVSPFDGDTLDASTPVLNWTHSESFSLLAPGESFVIVIAKMSKDQDAEAAVTANIPHYQMRNVLRHDIQYPADAPALKVGETYAWQVQKFAAGGQGVIAKSEAWKFTIREEKVVPDQKYAVLKRKPDAGYYFAANDKIFFRFDEPYAGAKLKCRILNEKQEELLPVMENEENREKGAETENLKTTGYNRFEMDLSPYNLKTGYYYLEVMNEKNEKYILKFYVE
jgi:hypothetical protein